MERKSDAETTEEARSGPTQKPPFETPARQKMDTLDRLGNCQYTIMVCLLYLRAYIRSNLAVAEQRPGFHHPWSTQGARQLCTEAEGAYCSHADAITCHDLVPNQQCYYDFKYDDEDTVLNELEEFYSYVEMPQAAENLKAWGGSFHGGVGLYFIHPTSHLVLSAERMDQESTIKAQSSCGTSSGESRTQGCGNKIHKCAQAALYFARFVTALRPQAQLPDQFVSGTFAETTSPEHQLHWIFENCKVVRDANGLSIIVEAMKIASSKHDLLGLAHYSDEPASLYLTLI
jgi:hypothetical protein